MQSRSADLIRGVQSRFRRGPWFLAALLLALASALVPALLPTGTSAARPLGSAFDPTTSVLTIRVREQDARVAVLRISEGDRTATPRDLPALLPAAPHEHAASALSYLAAPLAAVTPGLLPPSRQRSPAQPRAPPLRLA